MISRHVRVLSYREDGQFLVEPQSPEITIRQLEKQFGFEPASVYYERHRKVYRRMLAGRKPVSQQAAHGRRPQYAKP